MEMQFIVILLFLAGFFLMIVGLLVIPGFGVAEVLGLALLGVAIHLAFTRLNWLWGLATLGISLVVVAMLLFYLPRTSVGKQMRLSAQDRSQSVVASLEELTGKEGEVITTLRPAGTARIEGKKVDVVTEGVFLSEGTPVKVVQVKGNRVVVRQRGKVPPEKED